MVLKALENAGTCDLGMRQEGQKLKGASPIKLLWRLEGTDTGGGLAEGGIFSSFLPLFSLNQHQVWWGTSLASGRCLVSEQSQVDAIRVTFSSF